MNNQNASYWELTTFLAKSDYLIIGAGITGLNAAISLKSKNPGAHVVVVDKGSWGDGASYRNAGFACLGSPTELLADFGDSEMDKVMEIVEMRWLGLQFLISRVGATAMELTWCGGLELFPEGSKLVWEAVNEALPELNRQFKDRLGQEAVQFEATPPAPFFRNGIGQVHIRQEGRLHPGKMMWSLQNMARDLGIVVLGGIDVKGWEATEDGIRVSTASGHHFQTKRLGLATNGFTPRLVAGLDLQPARNQVYVTEQIPGLSWDHCLHVHQGYIYARRLGQRILIGGARHLDRAGENTDQAGTTEQIQTYLRNFLSTHFSIAPDVQFVQSWSGTMGIGTEKLPIIQELEENIFAAVRLGGMGVAIGSLVGDQLAQLMLSHS